MTPIAAIFETVEALREEIRSDASPLGILEALKPLFLEFAMNPTVLGPDEREALVSRIHWMLRKAHLIEGVDMR